jgi:hypothetical protein
MVVHTALAWSLYPNHCQPTSATGFHHEGPHTTREAVRTGYAADYQQSTPMGQARGRTLMVGWRPKSDETYAPPEAPEMLHAIIYSAKLLKPISTV